MKISNSASVMTLSEGEDARGAATRRRRFPSGEGAGRPVPALAEPPPSSAYGADGSGLSQRVGHPLSSVHFAPERLRGKINFSSRDLWTGIAPHFFCGSSLIILRPKPASAGRGPPSGLSAKGFRGKAGSPVDVQLCRRTRRQNGEKKSQKKYISLDARFDRCA
ncbi:hypothetical protein [Lysobacter antibioticus]|uniref:hypothetical protein n=1 Tax=Lysobacter antibioticus TaxID=84531 RepID=UPI0011E02862|nr:hypothetical protein [Lysobacter antibioticus]